MTTTDEGKLPVDHIEDATTLKENKSGDTALALFKDAKELHEPVDPIEEKRLIRKVDWMILPCLSVCYIFFYVSSNPAPQRFFPGREFYIGHWKLIKAKIDKTTLSYAAIFGINEDLHLSGTQYSWLSSIFYFGFIAWQLPTNLLMQRLPTAKYLSINIIMWGILLALQAVSRNFASLAVLRGLSGAAEACGDPAFMLITSMWYTRREQPIRIALWYSSLGLGIAGGGLLGYAIGQIKGALPSWRYEFIIIGALCIAWGIVMLLVLPDSPVTAPFLTPSQRKMAVERLRENQTGIENKNFKLHQLIEAFTDLKVLFFFMIALLQAIVNGGITNFGTLIVKGFGYTTRMNTSVCSSRE